VNVAKKQHVSESILAPTLVAALPLEFVWIFKCAKEHVPKWNVRKIIGVVTELMMDAVRFGPLKKVTNPRRRSDVPMVEEFPHRDENGVIAGGADGSAKQRIHNQAAKDGINQNFNRMLVKAGNDFKATG